MSTATADGRNCEPAVAVAVFGALIDVPVLIGLAHAALHVRRCFTAPAVPASREDLARA
ncbi:hypothetical protein STXM2123_5309 [Streptomyces sp. F-3]|uniref:hypothetical protein n=1 Tax=Streptomyces TaxID=1883 RepID=UPI0007C23E1B|nr:MULTISPECIES: hypothetical protein [Streptomyces]MDN5383414.1 hypothetical protein [Streptomyces sp. LB8]GAT84608.1 hypothetical protein STXM2123_5309 [Streptomyces sp. F-3]